MAQRIDIYKIEKKIRAEVIKAYMGRQNIKYAVCFSCGNASFYLRHEGVNILDISPSGDLTANRWFKTEEVKTFFPTAFDATSGHLPLSLMVEISMRLREYYQNTFDTHTEYEVMTGSGESIFCLKLAFPEINFIPVYDNRNVATEFSPDAPLNPIINTLFNKIIKL